MHKVVSFDNLEYVYYTCTKCFSKSLMAALNPGPHACWIFFFFFFFFEGGGVFFVLFCFFGVGGVCQLGQKQLTVWGDLT